MLSTVTLPTQSSPTRIDSLAENLVEFSALPENYSSMITNPSMMYYATSSSNLPLHAQNISSQDHSEHQLEGASVTSNSASRLKPKAPQTFDLDNPSFSCFVAPNNGDIHTNQSPQQHLSLPRCFSSSNLPSSNTAATASSTAAVAGWLASSSGMQNPSYTSAASISFTNPKCVHDSSNRSKRSASLKRRHDAEGMCNEMKTFSLAESGSPDRYHLLSNSAEISQSQTPSFNYFSQMSRSVSSNQLGRTSKGDGVERNDAKILSFDQRSPQETTSLIKSAPRTREARTLYSQMTMSNLSLKPSVSSPAIASLSLDASPIKMSPQLRRIGSVNFSIHNGRAVVNTKADDASSSDSTPSATSTERLQHLMNTEPLRPRSASRKRADDAITALKQVIERTRPKLASGNRSRAQSMPLAPRISTPTRHIDSESSVLPPKKRICSSMESPHAITPTPSMSGSPETSHSTPGSASAVPPPPFDTVMSKYRSPSTDYLQSPLDPSAARAGNCQFAESRSVQQGSANRQPQQFEMPEIPTSHTEVSQQYLQHQHAIQSSQLNFTSQAAISSSPGMMHPQLVSALSLQHPTAADQHLNLAVTQGLVDSPEAIFYSNLPSQYQVVGMANPHLYSSYPSTPPPHFAYTTNFRSQPPYQQLPIHPAQQHAMHLSQAQYHAQMQAGLTPAPISSTHPDNGSLLPMVTTTSIETPFVVYSSGMNQSYTTEF